jgi:uncharacterized protein (TIGR02996 family)
MAVAPSYRAPRARDVLAPPPFVPPHAPQLDAEERRLLDAVIQSPDDDGPRFNYSQWLHLQGQTHRAAFIDSQLRGEPATADAAWSSDFEPWCARHLMYRRGFVESMSLAGRAFITLGRPLFAMTPLRSVKLVAIAPFIAELATCEHARWLAEIDLRGNRISAAMIAAAGLSGLGPQFLTDAME